MRIGQNIRHLRKSKNLTQEELAKEIGVSPPSLVGYEKDEYFPKIPVILKISEFFDVFVDDLLKADLTQESGRPASSPPETAEEKAALQARVIDLLEDRIKTLEREILRKDPGLARELKIE